MSLFKPQSHKSLTLAGKGAMISFGREDCCLVYLGLISLVGMEVLGEVCDDVSQGLVGARGDGVLWSEGGVLQRSRGGGELSKPKPRSFTISLGSFKNLLRFLRGSARRSLGVIRPLVVSTTLSLLLYPRLESTWHSFRSRGGGFEVEIHYPQWRRVNKPIDRHNVLLDSLTKLVEDCAQELLSFYGHKLNCFLKKETKYQRFQTKLIALSIAPKQRSCKQANQNVPDRSCLARVESVTTTVQQQTNEIDTNNFTYSRKQCDKTGSLQACNDSSSSMDRWLSRLDSSNWMTHIKDTLNCACLVAQCLDQEGASVLVHGSEGLDATLLVTSLAQVILNPDCRTVRGMEALVEREWLQAGYPFPVRHNKSAYSTANNGRNKTQAPTFLLFLDCVQQIHQQFPCSFEFSTSFLILLHEHSYYSQFGTFLGTCESDRKSLKLPQQTVSLWSYLNRPEVLQSFLNPMYDPNNKVIWPSVAPMSLTLWSELFLRWVVDQGPQKEAWVTITTLREKDKELRLKACRLRRQLADLQKEAVEVGILAPSLAPPTTLPAEVA
uniref:Myotubularin phosphatase domain-containing protein n=1 Tax=Timema cristinae TaxID=61476 RepID=A0A7R9CJ95_TIMCR|nr:unnamed protein product [Timema cristinae]